MSGTKAGFIKIRQKLIEKYGSEEAYREHFRTMGSLGGKNGKGTLKGFAASPELASKAGRKGGRISKRKKKDENNI